MPEPAPPTKAFALAKDPKTLEAARSEIRGWLKARKVPENAREKLVDQLVRDAATHEPEHTARTAEYRVRLAVPKDPEAAREAWRES